MESMWQKWSHVWHRNLRREGEGTSGWGYNNNNTCYSKELGEKSTRTWAQAVHTFFPSTDNNYSEQLPPEVMWCQKDTEISDLPSCKCCEFTSSPFTHHLVRREKCYLIWGKFQQLFGQFIHAVSCWTCSTQGIQNRVQVKWKEHDVQP